MRIRVNYFIYIFCLLPFLEMPRFGKIPNINTLFLAWKLLAAIIVCVLLIKKRYKLNKLDISLIIYWGIVISSTLINHGMIVDSISDGLAILIPIFNVEMNMEKCSLRELITPIILCFSIYTTITAIQLLNVPFYVFATHGLRESMLYLYTDKYGEIFALGHPKRFSFIIFPLIIYALMLDRNNDIVSINSVKHTLTKIYIIIVSVFCLVYSWSVSAMITIAIILFFYHLYSVESISKIWKYLNVKLILCGFFVINILLLVPSFLNLFAKLLKLFGKTTTLSGRTYIWEKGINYIMQRPILGYGFDSKLVASRFWGLVHLHNYLLNSLYIGGILLLICIVYVLILLAKHLSQIGTNSTLGRALTLGFLGFLILSLTDTTDYNMLFLLFPFMYTNNSTNIDYKGKRIG